MSSAQPRSNRKLSSKLKRLQYPCESDPLQRLFLREKPVLALLAVGEMESAYAAMIAKRIDSTFPPYLQHPLRAGGAGAGQVPAGGQDQIPGTDRPGQTNCQGPAGAIGSAAKAGCHDGEAGEAPKDCIANRRSSPERPSASDLCAGIWQSSKAWGMPRCDWLQKNWIMRLRPSWAHKLPGTTIFCRINFFLQVGNPRLADIALN